MPSEGEEMFGTHTLGVFVIALSRDEEDGQAGVHFTTALL